MSQDRRERQRRAGAESLTDIGEKLPKAAILRTLDNPTAPMPSFKDMPEEKKVALVDFLSQLKGQE